MPNYKTRRKRHKYLEKKLSSGFVSLYFARAILTMAYSLLGLFLPIFLYKLLNFNIQYVIIYYLVGNLFYLFLIAYITKLLNKIDLKNSLRISLVWGGIFYFIFYLFTVFDLLDFNSNRQLIFILLLASAIVSGIHRSMYWVPVHTDMSKFTSKKDRGRQLSIFSSITVLLSALMPLLAGVILMKYNYDILFFIAIVLYFVALIPLINLPASREKFSLTYTQTWKELFSKKRRRSLLAFMGDGAEGTIRCVVWPIFIWNVVDGNYFTVGFITSAVVIITIVLQLSIGKILDEGSKEKMLEFGSVFYAIGWVIKMFIISSFQIFVISTYHSFANIFTRTPFDVLLYENAFDQGHFVDEYTVIHEMAIMLGKVVAAVLIMILVVFVSLKWVFMLAAIATLAMNFIIKE